MWLFPLKNYQLPLPEGSHPGAFGTVRKHDIHTGVDLYCNPGDEVLAVEDGVVVALWAFTGDLAESPWWNNTFACAVKGKSGIVLYGEIQPTVSIGQPISQGSVVGTVLTVLKKDKGRPLTMLHLELYSKLMEPVIWNLNEKKPEGLEDPTGLLKQSLK